MAKVAVKDDEIDDLGAYRQTRLRTDMWFGSVDPTTEVLVQFDGERLKPVIMTFVPALATYCREVWDNALDEFKKGFGNRLDIDYNPVTMEFSVEDNGRGIPLDKVETVFTKLFSGRNFRERGEQGGMNGVGASTTNFTSSYFRVTIRRDGVEFRQEFKEDPFGFAERFGPAEVVIGKPTTKPYAGRQTGTKIEFHPSEQVYAHRELPLEFVQARAWEIAQINPKIKVFFNGELLRSSPTMEQGFFQGLDPIRIDLEDPESKFRSTFYLVPRFTEAKEELVHSVVNNIPAYNGGTHIVAFRSVFYRGLLEALAKESRRRKLTPNSADVSEGLLIYNVTRMEAPSFSSQSKDRLTNILADKVVRRHFDGEAAFKKIIKEHGEWIDQIYARCAERTTLKDENVARQLQKGVTRARIAKLVDANDKDRSKCILFLGEGDSALKELKDARDEKIHGLLPLRGKVMNVYGKSATEIMQNEALTDMMGAIGLKRGERAIRSGLRYGKVYIATDEDDDGLNIFALLINFFYRGWPELFDPTLPPFFYRFGTPFIILQKGPRRSYIFGEDYDKFKVTDWKGWNLIRAKGLSTLEQEDWEHVLENPRVVPFVDDGKLSDALDLIFDQVSANAADRRKDWIGM